MDGRRETSGSGGRAALALKAYAAQVREAVGKALEALDQASARVAEWAGKPGRPIPFNTTSTRDGAR